MDGERYAVVSCHVERPLDDDVWAAFSSLQSRAPGGFRVSALMRPPAAGEDEDTWVRRAREAGARAPLGHHTHFGGPATARPTDPPAAAGLFAAEADWIRDRGLEPRYFCGGGWYADEPLAEELARRGYVDLSAVAFALPWLGPGETHLRAESPRRLRLPSGAALLELPSTHSLGGLVRGFHALPAGLVHVHFHDWELLRRGPRAALAAGLRALARRARPLDLDEAAALYGGAPEVPLRDVLVR